MATVNERLAALEAAIKNVTPGTTTYSAGAPTQRDAQQDARLAALEGQQHSTEVLAAGLNSRLSAVEGDYATDTALVALEARVTALEDKPGGPVAWVRPLSTSIGTVGAENITTVLTTNPEQTYAELVLSMNPVAYWRFGEASGNPQDSSGNGHHVTVVGGTPIYGATGAISGDSDTAITLAAASSEYFTVPDHVDLDLGDGPLSIACWVKRTTHTTGTYDIILAKYSGGYGLAFDDSDRLNFVKSGVAWVAYSTAQIRDTLWHHFVATKNGSTRHLYIDGVEDINLPADQTFADTAGVLEIGRENALDYLDGTIDELAIFDTVLTPLQVGQLYAGVGGGGGGGSGTKTVSSIADLKYYLGDNSVTEIIVTDGTYTVNAASYQQASSLWIGSAYAGRTNPVTIRAATTGGVTFSGNGTNDFGGLYFNGGACYQTWQGFKFANGTVRTAGVIVFGGYQTAGAHHITLQDITIEDTCVGQPYDGTSHEHGVYFSGALGGDHDILIDNLHVDSIAWTSGGLASAITFGKAPSGSYMNAWNVLVRNLNTTGNMRYGLVPWEGDGGSWTVEDALITGAQFGIRYEPGALANQVFRRVTTTGSTIAATYSSAYGNNPASWPNTTIESCSFG